MNVPNQLTLGRIILTFVIMALVFVPGLAAKAWALGLFLIACLTDWLDGFLARRLHHITPFGILFDPIADKVLILGALLSFVQLRLAPAWMVAVIVARELLVTGVRLYAANRQIVIPAVKEGKHKMVSQVVAVAMVLIVLVVQEALGERISPSAHAAMQRLVLLCLWVTVVLTVVSGASFFWRNRSMLRDAAAR